MNRAMRGALVASIIAAGVGTTARASAFCGFYVSGADAKLFNNATQVVMMRDGTRTVLSMQNDYEGPPENFAMVVPVPVVLSKENVKTLPKEIFEKIDKLTAPRLVEYWEQDPCGGGGYYDGFGGGMGLARASRAPSAGAGPAMDLGVTVEARFDVGEYDVVILSAKDSGGLDTWLKQENYKIPNGAEPFLRPYVQNGSKFFVAKVDPKRVNFEKGRAALSPLRFHYDSTDFTLPVRLGLINSRGTQDLIVNILASQRYEPVNYPAVTIPTNLDLAQGSKEHFGRFYTALFDRTLEKHPKAVVTEYSWDASTCDPCPGPALYPQDFAELGADALPPPPGSPPPTQTPRASVAGTTGNAPPATQKLIPSRYLSAVQQCWQKAQSNTEKKKLGGKIEVKVSWADGGKVTDASIGKNESGDPEIATCVKEGFTGGIMTPEAGSLSITYDLAMSEQRQMQYRSWTITRLHARYTKESLGEDLVFKAAEPITGGREVRDGKGDLEHGSTKASMNNFQGRYAIRHPWIGPITCKEPHRGVWGGPWHDLAQSERQNTGPTAAEKLAFAPRGGVTLANFVRTDVPELGVVAGKGPLPLTGLPAASASAGAGSIGDTSTASSSGGTKPAGSGCGACVTAPSSSDDSSGSLAVLGGAFALAMALGRRVSRDRAKRDGSS